MEKQNHIFDDLIVIFSQERLDGYLSHAHCSNNKNEALIAYSWNIALSEALHPALQILEISLRNSLHRTISEYFQPEQWLELSFLHEKEQKKVLKAKQILIDKKSLSHLGASLPSYLLVSGFHYLISGMNMIKHYGPD